MFHFLLLFLFFIIAIILYEFILGYFRQKDRQYYYKLAENRSKQLNKPLIVYGDPYNGIGSKRYNKFMKTYGYGDETVDLTGCPNCPNGIKQDILIHLKSKPYNSCVIFSSCVLEYIEHIDEVIQEIKRVAGSLDNIFIVTVNPYTISSRFYKDKNDTSRNVVFSPPKYNYLTYKKI
jgi:hypothetical protein